MYSFFDYLDHLDSAKSMLRTLAGFSELMSMTIIQRSPLRKSLARTNTLRIQAQKGGMALSIREAATMGSYIQEACSRCPHGLLGAEIPLGSPGESFGSDLRLEVHGCTRSPQGSPGMWQRAQISQQTSQEMTLEH